jgi:hypothetical protein
MSVIRTTALPGQLHNMCNTQRELIHFYVYVYTRRERTYKNSTADLYKTTHNICNSVKNKRNIDAAGKCDAFLLV